MAICTPGWGMEMPRERAEGLKSDSQASARNGKDRIAVIVESSPCRTTPWPGPISSQELRGQRPGLAIKGRAELAGAYTCF